MTYTYAILDVHPDTFDDIESRLRTAGRDCAIHNENDGRVLDMHGLAVRADKSNEQATYLYFLPGGKWKYEGRGASIPTDGQTTTHDRIRELNGGSFPGLSGDARSYTIIVLDPHSFPRLVPAVK